MPHKQSPRPTIRGYPLVRIYGPNGALLDSDFGAYAAEVTTRATNTGTFTVVAANAEPYSPGGNGGFHITLALSTPTNPVVVAVGDDGGDLTNGFTHTGSLLVGDADVWRFTANSGDGIVVRLGESVGGSTLYPWVRIYGPNGALLDSDFAAFASEVTTRATNTGTFTVVAVNAEPYSPGGNGNYLITLATTKTNTPLEIAGGDEGGNLTNGYTHTGTLSVGDADVWSFTANSGDGIVVRLGESVGGSTLYPWVRIYGPNGALLSSDFAAYASEVTTRATNTGTFTVVAVNAEPYSPGGNGNYRLTLSASTASQSASPW